MPLTDLVRVGHYHRTRKTPWDQAWGGISNYGILTRQLNNIAYSTTRFSVKQESLL